MKPINPTDVINWVNEIERIPNDEFNCPLFLKPIHLVTMGLAIQRGKWNNFQFPPSLENYAIRMKLWESVNMCPPHHVNEHSQSGRFLPVQRFDEHKRDVQEVANKLAKIVIKTTSKEYQDSLSICLGEIVNNFFDHANTSGNLPCLISAQTWGKGELVQIAIADSGIGIRKSLSNNNKLLARLNNDNACELASELGITGNPTEHSGYGLAIAKDLMKACNGTYMLYSGDELFWLNNGHAGSEKSISFWQGTILILEWRVDKTLNIRSVYDNWPLPEGFNNDDFF